MASDLNECIVPYDKNVWNSDSYDTNYILCQNNMNNTYLAYCATDGVKNKWVDKSTTSGNYEYTVKPFFQINYRE